MSITKKITILMILGLSLFSGSAQKLLKIASNAIESEAFADGPSGATCN